MAVAEQLVEAPVAVGQHASGIDEAQRQRRLLEQAAKALFALAQGSFGGLGLAQAALQIEPLPRELTRAPGQKRCHPQRQHGQEHGSLAPTGFKVGSRLSDADPERRMAEFLVGVNAFSAVNRRRGLVNVVVTAGLRAHKFLNGLRNRAVAQVPRLADELRIAGHLGQIGGAHADAARPANGNMREGMEKCRYGEDGKHGADQLALVGVDATGQDNRPFPGALALQRAGEDQLLLAA